MWRILVDARHRELRGMPDMDDRFSGKEATPAPLKAASAALSHADRAVQFKLT
ncbi:MAG: hypothetical protein ACK4LQ_14955 [Pararhodobacter sp.]